MGGSVNKLLAEIDGEAMVRRVVRTVLSSRAARVVVVLGHEAERIRAALEGLRVAFVENSDHLSGMASSLRVGVEAAGDADSILVVLADMPWIGAETIDRLIAEAGPGRIVVPTREGRRGNPVLWDRSHFPRLLSLSGDVGARAIIAAGTGDVKFVPVDDPGVLRDADTPEALFERL